LAVAIACAVFAGTELIEIDANRFAAELTMPHAFLLRALGNSS
jgi:hypothetical protein